MSLFLGLSSFLTKNLNFLEDFISNLMSLKESGFFMPKEKGIFPFENTQKGIEASFEEFVNQTKAFGNQFQKLLDDSMKQFTANTDVVIKTNVPDGQEKAEYCTTINALTGNITTTFPSKPMVEGDIWKTHKELVDKTLESRKELQLKIIETVGSTIKGLFNPISISNIDLVQILQAILANK